MTLGNIKSMKKQFAAFVFLCWVVSAGSVFASVRFSEIAWMGTEVSSADEWIELYNDSSSAIDLSGWHIEATDGSPNILLTGTIAPYAYFLIERTDDATVPNIAADVVAPFGNGLSNGGETLRLNDASNVSVDTVIGGASWVNIGGDSTTKQTAQRLHTGNSWITATGTPRAVNASSGEVEGVNTTSQGSAGMQTGNTASPGTSGGAFALSGVSGNKGASPASVYPRTEMTVFAGADQRVFTGFSASFFGRALGLYDEPLRYATYRWNFGDGSTADGSAVTHKYYFPGEYTVTLEVSYGQLKNSERIVVVVTDPDVVITRMATGTDGFIELSNRTGREIDLSGWLLVQPTTDTKFFFNPNTILLSSKSIRFPNVVTQFGDTSGVIELRTPSGVLAYAFESLLPTSGTVLGVTAIKRGEVDTTKGMPKAKHAALPTPSGDTVSEDKIVQRAMMLSASDTAAAVLWERGGIPVSGQLSSEMKWFFIFMGLLLVALAAFIIARSRVDEATIANEYAIIEDIIESEADLVRQSERIIKE